MKLKNLFYFFILALAIPLSFTACSDKDDDPIDNPDPKPGTDDNKENQLVNKWIYDEMSEWYYWNDKIPAKNQMDFNLDPETFFYNHVLFDYLDANKDGEGDRFSWMEPYTPSTKANSNGKSDIGFDYLPAWADDSEYKVALIVNYIKPGTTAERMGIKRGFIIDRVDGSEINSSNWYSVLLQNKSSYEIEYSTNAQNYNKDIFEKKTVTVTSNYKDNPILMDTIYRDIDGHNIGYLVFNTFGTSQDEENLNNNIYLIERLTRFESEGITDLVLDLRYNGGGLVQTAVYLGSALVPNRDTKNIFQISRYNKTFQAKLDALPENNATKQSWMYDKFVNNIYWKGDNEQTSTLNKIPNLGNKIKTLCVLGTGSTASSSEMVINCLRPYITNLYLVGEKTVGKNVGSWTMEPDNDNIKWKLQPITFQTYNVKNKSDYAKGMIPDVHADDFDLLGTGLKSLGDIEETLLATAIEKITNKVKSSKTKEAKVKGLNILPSSEIEKRKGTFQMTIDKKEVIGLKKQLKILEQ